MPQMYGTRFQLTTMKDVRSFVLLPRRVTVWDWFTQTRYSFTFLFSESH